MTVSSKSSTRALALLLAAVAIGGCNGKPDNVDQSAASPTATSAPVSELRYVARWTTPRDELMTPEGTFVRAFYESVDALIYGGDSRFAFPGFAQANEGAVSTDPRPPNASPAVNYFGLAGTLGLTSGAQRAIVCLYGANGDSAGRGFLDFERTGTPPPASQTGVNARPTGNVFGGWRAIRKGAYDSEETGVQTCAANLPTNLDTSANLHQPDPGWP